MHEEAIQLIDQCAPSEKLYKALNFMINQWESLIYYLKDGRILATSNIAEREGIKPFINVMARKEFFVCGYNRRCTVNFNVVQFNYFNKNELAGCREVSDLCTGSIASNS